MEEDEPDPVREAAQGMESEAEEMQELSEKLGDHIDETRADWKRKRADSGVPGAVPPAEDAGEQDAEGEGPAADEAGQ
jgi:hypothetical protein